eukprot:7514379-Pyramimonas_sp.AAC.1
MYAFERSAPSLLLSGRSNSEDREGRAFYVPPERRKLMGKLEGESEDMKALADYVCKSTYHIESLPDPKGCVQ